MRKKYQEKKRYQMNKSLLGGYTQQIHRGMRYPLTHTKLKMSNSQREDGSKQTKLSTKFHDGTKYQKENRAFHQHTLDKDPKKSVLKKIG